MRVYVFIHEPAGKYMCIYIYIYVYIYLYIHIYQTNIEMDSQEEKLAIMIL